MLDENEDVLVALDCVTLEDAILSQFPPISGEPGYLAYDMVLVRRCPEFINDNNDPRKLRCMLELTRDLQEKGLEKVGNPFWSTGYWCIRAKVPA